MRSSTVPASPSPGRDSRCAAPPVRAPLAVAGADLELHQPLGLDFRVRLWLRRPTGAQPSRTAAAGIWSGSLALLACGTFLIGASQAFVAIVGASAMCMYGARDDQYADR